MYPVIWPEKRLETVLRFYVSFWNDVEKDRDIQ